MDLKRVEGGDYIRNIGERYGIDVPQGKKLIKMFNESALLATCKSQEMQLNM